MSSATSGAAAAGFPVGDLKSGFLVFLIALPLCLGIAVASNFPAVAGVLTAIVGGVLVSHLGHARLTIKGPAAGLIVIVIGAVTELGAGDPIAGYKRALAVGVVAAILQIVFALLRIATLGIAMSPSVVHGMLAAIGVIIISKQSHVLLGVTPTAHEPLGLLAEIPHSLAHANPHVAIVGAVSLLLLFGLPRLPFEALKRVPAQLIVLAFAVPMALAFGFETDHTYDFMGQVHTLGPNSLVTLPGSIRDALAFPDFSQITSLTSIRYIVMYALVGTIESTLTVLAVDSIDPVKKPSDLNRDLFALGVGNLVSASIGGLPMISEVVRSKANVDAGARTRWSNFFHGAFLLISVALFPTLLHQIPLAALAAMLIFTGIRLASPAEFRHVWHIGPDQFLLFTTTLVVTLATDLLIGVGCGLVLKILLHWTRGVSPLTLVRSKLDRTRNGSDLRIRLQGAAGFPSILQVREHLRDLDGNIDRVIIDLREARLVDHTFLNRVEALGGELKTATLVLEGLDDLKSSSDHPHASRRR